MAALAQIGLMRMPKNGYSTPAATGKLSMWQMNARKRVLFGIYPPDAKPEQVR
jgi:hypothetical protein